ncbi:DUF6950 family protein [Sphingomonas sp. OTU376]|uniref:DUF6950 family protein n=1 Tax=Sphingomonas sp. OTU376 TaxID=3043863 RepID=UPI00313AAD01
MGNQFGADGGLMAKKITPPRNLHERAERMRNALAWFEDKPFSWQTSANCIHALRALAVAFGRKAPPVPRFRTPLGARRAIRRRGHADLRSLIGAYLGPEIAPAMAIVGDAALLPGEGLGAVVFYAGGGQWLGWHGEDQSRMQAFSMPGDAFLAAWRM